MHTVKTFLDDMIYKFTEQPRGLDFSRNAYPYADESDNVWYERTAKKHIRTIFSYFEDKRLPVMDLGCGKGYVLYQLQKMGFARTDGIEYNPEFVEIAQANMEKLGLSKKVRIHCMDAREFENFDSYGIVYMFHPFGGKTMQAVLQNIEESLVRRPRKFYAVYFYPVEHLMWDESPFFVRKMSMVMEFLNTELDVYYYEHDPARKPRSRPRFRDVLENKLGY